MMKILVQFLSLSLMVFTLGCYPSGPDRVEDLDAVLTVFDEDFQFDSRKTYAMPDKIVIDIEVNRFGDTTYIYMNQKFADQILAAIDENMANLGWQKTQLNFKPDVLVTPAAIKSTSYYYSSWYNWWYGGFYGSGWGWYYPPAYTVSSTTSGTLFITLVDPNVQDSSPLNQSETAWLSVANGLILGNYNEVRVLNSINQSFKQSPYLNIN